MMCERHTVRMLNLFELQQALQASILRDLVLPELQSAFYSSENLDVRFQVYAKGYELRALESLSDDFPHVKRLIGDGAFELLCKDFCRGSVSRYWSLAKWSQDFATFINAHSILVQHPYLHDLAKLEWALLQIDQYEDIDIPDLALLKDLTDAQQSKVRIHLYPHSIEIFSRWNIDEIRLERKIKEKETTLIILPSDQKIVSLSKNEIHLFNELKKGLSLSDLERQFEGLTTTQVEQMFFKFMKEKLIWKFTL